MARYNVRVKRQKMLHKCAGLATLKTQVKGESMAQEKRETNQAVNSHAVREEQDTQQLKPKYYHNKRAYSNSSTHKIPLCDIVQGLDTQPQTYQPERTNNVRRVLRATYEKIPENIRSFMYSTMVANPRNSREQFYEFFCSKLRESHSRISSWVDAVLWMRIQELAPETILETAAEENLVPDETAEHTKHEQNPGAVVMAKRHETMRTLAAKLAEERGIVGTHEMDKRELSMQHTNSTDRDSRQSFLSTTGPRTAVPKFQTRIDEFSGNCAEEIFEDLGTFLREGAAYAEGYVVIKYEVIYTNGQHRFFDNSNSIAAVTGLINSEHEGDPDGVYYIAKINVISAAAADCKKMTNAALFVAWRELRTRTND